MLYERWCRIASEFSAEIALVDLASNRRWTFAELRSAGVSWEHGQSAVVYPEGNSPEFICTILSAWRQGKAACPQESGQSAPDIHSVPPRCIHLKTTSGTTGNTRLIAFTGEQLAADAENIVSTMGLCREWPNVGVVSLAHSYGFSNLVLPLLLHGIPLILAESPLPESLRRATEGRPATTVAAVPAMWRAWFEANAITSNIRLAISAGAPLPLNLEQAVFETAGLKIHNFYGSSECGGIAFDRSNEPRKDAACVGEAMQNVTLSVNADGCLVVRSRAVGETYWPEPSRALAGRRFETADLAELKNGLVYLRGRAGYSINVAGRKVSPGTIEHVLMGHPTVRGCLVFGVPSPDPGRGEDIVACVEVSAAADKNELRQFLLERLPSWQVPRAWWIVDSLAANQRGKISREEWRGRYMARMAAP